MIFFNNKNKQPLRQANITPQNEEHAFRRSRTLTGAVSSNIKAAAENRNSHLISPRLHLQELRKHRRTLFAGIGLSLVCLALLGWLLSQFVAVNTSDIVYASQVTSSPPSDTYAKKIKDYFKKQPLERFNFLLNSDNLAKFVAAEFPEVSAIEVATPIGSPQSVTISLRKPLLSWSVGIQDLYVDNSGISFNKSYFPNPNLSVKDQTGANLGQEVLVSSRFIEFVGRVVGYVAKADIGEVNEVIIPRGSLREVDLKLKNNNFVIKTHIDREPYLQAQDVINAVNYVQGKKLKPKYIDVRVAGKAFYK